MYHVLYTDGGALVGVTTEDVIPFPGISVVDFDGDVPNLNKVTWDKDTLSFTVSTAGKVHSTYEFMSLFTQEERIAILNSTDDTVKDFVAMINLSDTINASDAFIISSINYLESVNLLTNERAHGIIF